MEHQAVSSSQIASVAHDPSSDTMQVLFRRGGLYEYADVSATEFESVLKPSVEFGGSIGTAFVTLIKGRKAFHKIEGEQWPPINGKPAAAKPAPAPADTPTLPAEVQAVSHKSTELTTQASDIQVTDLATQEQASEVLLAIASMRKEIADTFKPMKDAAFKAHKVVCDQERGLDSPLAEAERTIKGRIGAFVQEQRRLAAEIEAEERRQAKLRADLEASNASQEQAIEQAIDLEARGDDAGAEAVLANPAPVPARYVAPAPVSPAVAQVKGVSTRVEWDYQIVDFDKIPREYLLVNVNEAAIRNAGKSTKGRIRIPGVEFFEKTVVAASRRG